MFDLTDELLKKIELGEDSRIELKDLRYREDQVIQPDRKSMADELAAMANTISGVLVLGVDDKSKTVVGIPHNKLDIVETWIRDICNDLIVPQLNCDITKVPVTTSDGEEKVIIRADISRSVYVHKSPGGYFNRIGSSKRQMNPDVLSRLFQQRSQARMIYFDEQAVATAPVDCLDEALWGKFRTSQSPVDDNEFLSKLKILTQDQDGKTCPSVSGILMACNEPHEFIRNAFIQAVYYKGTERNASYQLDAKDITGSLDVQIYEAYKFVEKNMNVYAIKNPEREDIPQYSMQAVFEALVNAVAHRDYSIHGSKIRLHMFSDHLEIFSPGTIPNTVTIESIAFRQATRNELLTILLSRCPLRVSVFARNRKSIMDRRGEGVPIIISKSEELSGQLPKYKIFDDSELMLTIYATQPPNSE